DRREDLLVEDQALQAGYVLLENGRRAGGEFLALRGPLAAAQRKRSVLHEDRHHVLPRRGEIRIDDGRDRHVEEGRGRWLSVLRIIVRALDVFQRRAHTEVRRHPIVIGGPRGPVVEV